MPPVLLSLSLFAGIGAWLLLFLHLGYRLGHRRSGEEPAGVSTVDGAVFALVGFLLAFAFAGAQERLQQRREAIVNEANAIGTAYLRVDLVEGDRAELQDLFRSFTDARIAAAKKLPDLSAAKEEWSRSQETGLAIWRRSVAGTAGSSGEANRRLLLDAVNEMLDRATDRQVAVQTHLPLPVLGLLLGLTSLAALLAGRGMAGPGRSRIHPWILAAVFAAVLTVLVDFEYPRIGWIGLQGGDNAMLELRASMDR